MKDTFLDFVHEFEDKYNTKVLAQERKIIAIPTGAVSLDACIGVGGIPTGKLTILWGDEGSGKTTTALVVLKNAALMGMKGLYVDAENMLDHAYARKLIGEELFDKYITIIQPDTAEDVLELTGRAIQSGEYGLIILDSTGALSPEKEKKEQDFRKQDVSLVSRLITKFIRIYFHSMRINNVALLVISQLRAKIGGFSKFKTYEMSGGHALKHAASVIVFLTKAEHIKEGDVVVGINIRFVIKKNKLAAPFRGFTYGLMFDGGIDTERDMVEFSKVLGVIQQRGPYYKFNDEIIGRGLNDVVAKIKANPEMYAQVREAVMKNITHYKVEDTEEDVVIEDEEEAVLD